MRPQDAALLSALRRKLAKAESEEQRIKESLADAQEAILAEDERKRTNIRNTALDRVVERRRMIEVDNEISLAE